MSGIRLAILVILGLLSTSAATGGPSKERCLGGLKAVLMAGGFTGSTNCRKDKLAAKRIGVVRAHGREYAVYDYRYQLSSICPDCAIHGGQRVIFIRAGRYVGQYKPDSADVAFVKGNLVLAPTSGVPGARSVTVRLTRSGPPNRVVFDGQLLEFFR